MSPESAAARRARPSPDGGALCAGGRGRTRGLALSLSVSLSVSLLALGGCVCGHPCYTEDDLPLTRSLATPYDTVDFVRFCARHELWGPLYDVLSKETLASKPFDEKDGIPTEVGRALFAIVFPGRTIGDTDDAAPPAIADLPLVEVMASSAIVRIDPRMRRPVSGIPRERQAYVALSYPPIDGNRLIFVLVDEGTEDAPRWKLGLQETARWLGGA